MASGHPGRVPSVRIGLALPQYDYSVAGESVLQWSTIVEYASAADRAGYDSLWLSDHLFLDLAKYGGPPERRGVFDPLDDHRRVGRRRHAAALGHLGLVRGVAPGVGVGQVARVARSHLRRPSRRGDRRGLVRAGVRRHRHGDAGPGGAPGPSRARRSRCCGGCSAVGRSPSTASTTGPAMRAVRPVGGPAPAPADHHRGQGRPAARVGRRARRRLEHVLGVDTEATTASGSRCSTRVRRGRS